MKICVTGSRDWSSWQKFCDAINDVLPEDIFWNGNVSFCQGGAKGADAFCVEYCKNGNLPCKLYEADWTRYGKAAGAIRNTKMLNDFKPDLVLAFYKIGAANKGTTDCYTKALNMGIKVIITTD